MKVRVVTIFSLLALLCLSQGCLHTEKKKVVLPTPPSWWHNPRHSDKEYMFVKAGTEPRGSEHLARESAYSNALSILAKQVMTNVNVVDSNVRLRSNYAFRNVDIFAEKTQCIDGRWYAWMLIRYPQTEKEELLKKIQSGSSEVLAKTSAANGNMGVADPRPSLPPPAAGARSYLMQVDGDTFKYREVNNRFQFKSKTKIIDNELNVNWILVPDKLFNWDEAEEYCKHNGGRIPTLKELQSLIVKEKNDSDWGKVNGTFFPAHERMNKFWTSTQGGFFLFTPSKTPYYVDLENVSWKQASKSDYYALILIEDK